MNTADHEKLIQEVRVMQLITAAMVVGVALFAGVVALVANKPDAEREPFISLIALSFAVVAAISGFVLPRVITHQSPHATSAVYQISLLFGLAIFEAAAFFNVVAYLVERQSYSLAVVGILVLLMMVHFPTVRGVEEWLARRERDAQHRRDFGG